MRVTEIHAKKPINTANKLEVEEKIKKMRKEYEKLVKGKFEFLDAQGGWIDFNYKMFPGDPIVRYHLEHGEICELPMGIVKHLNNTVKKVRKANMQEIKEGTRGVPVTYETTSRLSFRPLEFVS